MENKDLAGYTIAELVGMGYEVVIKKDPVGSVGKIHMHVSNDAIEVSKKDYWQMLDEITKPAKASPALRKLFGVHKGIDN